MTPQTPEQVRQIAERAERFHTAIHQARTPDQIREICQATAADDRARTQDPSAGQAVTE
ncbi:hypothetical protein ACFXPX_13735 [Kitasatospora sp. NPDC059146]|uniref:hypothetical protein n=1 Tax=Kitasatospora sp. NPDC059146 TaxID=3346741 RepID=UPI0036C78B3F